MTPEQREELKQAAMKATPGPWRECGHDRGGCVCGAIWATERDELVAEAWKGDDMVPRTVVDPSVNAGYIARANPAAILSLIAQVEALTVQQWISVEDRLPPIGEEVIVFVPRGRVPVTALMRLIRWEGSTDFYWDNGYPGKGNMHIGTSITHWMSMPDAPTIPAIPGTKEGA